MNLNKAMIIGNLTRDPEIRNTPTGTPVATFSVATNMVWNDQNGQKQERVEFHNIVAWRRLAEICGQYLRKGSKVYIEGRLQTRDWMGQDNIKRYRTEIIAENMIMLDRSGGQGQNAYYGDEPPMPSMGEPAGGHRSSAAGFDMEESSDDEIKVENIPF